MVRAYFTFLMVVNGMMALALMSVDGSRGSITVAIFMTAAMAAARDIQVEVKR